MNYHEPYASSASELVTELLQYIMEPNHLLRAEAEALLAGIVLDTKNFTMRTGGRTVTCPPAAAALPPPPNFSRMICTLVLPIERPEIFTRSPSGEMTKDASIPIMFSSSSAAWAAVTTHPSVF